MGAKYFSNNSLTLRAGTREQEVQQELVLDAQGETGEVTGCVCVWEGGVGAVT